MSSDERGSVSVLLAGLKAGEAEALAPLWDRYFGRVTALARARLGRSRTAVDGEDVALDALHSLCRGAAAGRFPRLQDRDDLWRILACLAARKAGEARRDAGRLKRGGTARAEAGPGELQDLLSAEPSPEEVAELGETCRRMLGALPDESLRRVALLKMEGLTNEEIACELRCVPRTVERKLALVRRAWTDAG